MKTTKYRIKYRIVSGFILLLVCLIPQAVLAVEARTATIDLPVVLDSLEARKAAISTLEKEFEVPSKEVEEQGKKVTKLVEEYKAVSAKLDKASLAQREKDFAVKLQEYQKKYADLQARMTKREQEYLEPLVKNLRTVISSVATEKGYTMVVDKSQYNVVLYSSDSIDISKEVIARFNQKFRVIDNNKSNNNKFNNFEKRQAK